MKGLEQLDVGLFEPERLPKVTVHPAEAR